jgi:hypothetical protein
VTAHLGLEQRPGQTLSPKPRPASWGCHFDGVGAVAATLRIEDHETTLPRQDEVIEVARLELDAVDPAPDHPLALGATELIASGLLAPGAAELRDGLEDALTPDMSGP